MVRQIILAGFVVVLAAGAQAQGRGGMGSVSRGGGVAVAPRMVQAQHAGAARAMPGPRTVMRNGVGPRTGMPTLRGTRSQFTTRGRFNGENGRFRPGCSSVPGLGFDVVHQAATCGGTLGFRGRGFQDPFFFPMFDGGFSVPGSPVGEDDGSMADSAPPAGPDPDVRETGRRYRAAQAAPPSIAPPAETASSAPPDNEEFVFVRRDGTVFFAVAYAWEKGTLRYITPEGLRHTVTQDALDLDATQQFNEQRGLNFRSPV
jgi:hypothetical protein